MWGYRGKIGRLRQMMVGTSVLLAGYLWILLQVHQHDLPSLTGDVSFGTSGGKVNIEDNIQLEELPGLETFRSIDDRPLFSPSRRPSQDQGRQSGVGTRVLIGSHVLQGIVIGETQRTALLVDPTTGITLRLAEGEDVGGWVAKEIGEDFVRFESKGVERMIRLAKPAKNPDN